MTLGLYEERARRRRNRRWALLRWVFVLAAIGAVAAFAYESGRSLAEAESIMLRDEMGKLTAVMEESQKSRARLEVELAEAQRARQLAEQRYARDVPQGELGGLLALVQEKLASGVDEDRMVKVLGAVENDRECNDEAVTKRFIVTTPLSGGDNGEVRFVNGKLIVTAQGESALTAEGKPEAWFDTAKPVMVRFQVEGGEAIDASAVLPLTRSVILGDREHIFAVSAGARGFVEVSRTSCQFP